MNPQQINTNQLPEALDREVDEAVAEQMPQKGPAQVLIICDSGELTDSLQQVLRRSGHHCASVISPDQFYHHCETQHVDLVLLNVESSKCDASRTITQCSRNCPRGALIVFCTDHSAQAAISAIRAGASDYITLPCEDDEVMRRIDVVLAEARRERNREERLDRLKSICAKLNEARHEVSNQVDVLCKDLVAAYQEVANQINDVAIASEFRTLVTQELDVEDLLRTMLEFLLTKTGPTNAAVFLPDNQGYFGLGAYVNFDCPRETISILLDHLCDAVCPQMADEPEIVTFTDAEQFAQWIGIDCGFLADSQVIAYSCRHEGECMAVIVLFRAGADPFDEVLGSMIDILRPIFAEQLSHVIQIHHRAQPQWPDQPMDDAYDYEEDDYGFGFGGGLAA